MNAEHTTAEVAWRGALELGESPRWFAGAYHWVDIATGTVLRWDAPSAEPERTVLGGTVSAVFDAGDGTTGVVAGSKLLRLGPAGVETLRELPDDAQAHGRTNDARVDPHGRLWLGTVGTGADERTAVLRVVDTVAAGPVREGLTLSNGIAFDSHGDMFHADTFDHVVLRYRLDAQGDIAEVEPFVRFGEELPDGLCVDAQDGVWVALWGGGRVERYDAEGRRTHVIETPGASQVTSMAFGGPQLDDILITTAAEDADEPEAGSVFRARVGLRGVAEVPYAAPGAASDREGVR